MTPIDLDNELVELDFLTGARRVASANGVGIDVSKYQGKLKVVLNSAAGTGGDHTMDVKMQDSADSTDGSDGTWADVAGATFAQVTNAAAVNEGIGVDTRAVRQWLRAVTTIAGTSPVFDSAAVGVGQKQYK
ncbi:hypothetical protein KAR91_77560 [Candidatus Pacearchaeota archaeon]|nr:hypothetical protein [Candidatus Pacearchaeota archaeon]